MTKLEIEAFLMIIKTGSLSAAAQNLFVTQPALTRRVQALEEEIGYKLLNRRRGVRTIELTAAGQAFVGVARHWLAVWKETRSLLNLKERPVLRLTAIGSVNTYILPQVLQQFIQFRPENRLHFIDQHSEEAYRYVEQKLVDLALISDVTYNPRVETVPLFKEKMVLVAGPAAGCQAGMPPSHLPPEKEIRLPWYPEYELWHEYWFGNEPQEKALLNFMPLLEHFLAGGDTWALVPVSAVPCLKERVKVQTYPLREGPPDRVIYALTNMGEKPTAVVSFLTLLKEHLQTIEGVEVF
jgi:DNA-binding transcriptional LysR family regulator